MIYYLDSSVALQAVLPTFDQATLTAWFGANRIPLVSSRLLRTEVIRGVRREKRPLESGDWLLDRVNLIDITRRTHTRAETIERHINTLDALHLATATGLNAPVTIVTHDSGMRDVAKSLGLDSIDPITQ